MVRFDDETAEQFRDRGDGLLGFVGFGGFEADLGVFDDLPGGRRVQFGLNDRGVAQIQLEAVGRALRVDVGVDSALQ